MAIVLPAALRPVSSQSTTSPPYAHRVRTTSTGLYGTGSSAEFVSHDIKHSSVTMGFHALGLGDGLIARPDNTNVSAGPIARLLCLKPPTTQTV
jgi:hypothetical protein